VQSFLAFQALETPKNHFLSVKVRNTPYLKIYFQNTGENALFSMIKRERTPIAWIAEALDRQSFTFHSQQNLHQLSSSQIYIKMF
jgi:hypothetical protein